MCRPSRVTPRQGSGDRYRVATREVKRKTLNDLAVQRIEMPAAELGAILESALADDDPKIRVHGLMALASHGGGAVRLAPRDDLRERWARERLVVSTLRGHAVELLRDSDSEVREAAVLAVVNLDYDGVTERSS